VYTQLAAPLNETLDEDGQDVWENERTPTPVWRFEVRLSSITTQTARDILAKLCEWSDYEFEEPLKPHGARRRCDDHRWDRSTRSISYRMLIRRLRCTGSMALIIQYCCGEYSKVETMGLPINYCAVA